VTEVVTVASTLPTAVEEKRAAIAAAAQAGDSEALRPLIGPQFSYTFGGPVEGGPIAYWRELERTTDERPLETLGVILELPYTLSRGIYVWPFAYDKPRAALTDYELELLGGLADSFGPEGYLGWRAGIEADGDWVFFVAGD
jgi:hypothetical protein